MSNLPVNKGKILVMDDDEFVRVITEKLLNQLGYEVGFATDGLSAIELYKEAKNKDQPFDIVILDLSIRGGMGGQATVQKLLEIDPHVKAIISSGYSHDPVVSNYKEYGFVGVVPKPYGIQELAKAVSQIDSTDLKS